MEWKVGKYGGHSLSLGNGLVQASVNWDVVHGDYLACVGNYGLKEKFEHILDAQIAVEAFIKKRVMLMCDELGINNDDFGV